jgi:uncharacterized protein (TIGR03083 family)
MSTTSDSTSLAQSDPQALKAYYLDYFCRNRDAILKAAALGLDPPIKGCPGWDVAALTGHMGRVYTFWLKWVRERPRGHSKEAWAELLADREARLPGYVVWEKNGFPRESRPERIVEFSRRAGEELEAALVDLGPEETVWTFVPTRQTGTFVFRRIAMETAIHRWDAEQPHGIEQPIDEALALDGIDEMLMMFREDPGYDENKECRHGQRVLLRQHPGSARWLVTFENGGITTSQQEGPADVAISGSASDLHLFIMGRRTPEEMQIQGDGDLAAAWGDLAGRF